MGRRRSVGSDQISVRRSMRIRTMCALSEESEVVSKPESMHASSEDDEDSRKGVKPTTSRIPTFHSSLARKRPGQGIESLGQTRQEVSGLPFLPKDKAGHVGEANKNKNSSGRETALPIPSVRIPGVTSDAYAFGDHIESVSCPSNADSLPVIGKVPSKPEPYADLLRPALRSDSKSPGPNHTEVFTESVPTPTRSIQHVTTDDGDCNEPQVVPTECSDGQNATREGLSLSDEEKDSHFKDEKESCHVENCPDEIKLCEHVARDEIIPDNLELVQEPITVEKTNTHSLELMNTEEKSADNPSQDVSGEVLNKNIALPENCLAVSEKALHSTCMTDEYMDEPKQPSHQSTPLSSSGKTKRQSFTLFYLLPTVLLLLGGFGQHLWLYGIPRSTSHLLAQLELHWLEGLWVPQDCCMSDCRVNLVESIPDGLVFPPGSPLLPSIWQTWEHLLSKANKSVDIAAFYFTLTDTAMGLSEPSAHEGRQVFAKLMQLEPQGVKLRVAVNSPQQYPMDTEALASTGAEVRPVDLQSVTGGIIHTKLWVVDRKHLYVGSANMDWRSLTQVKEVGVSVENCSCLAQDMARIFGIYWDIGDRKNGSLPPYWPGRFSALSSADHPLVVNVNGVSARVYLSSAPNALSAQGRSDDLQTILSVIGDAKKFVYISVMDYLPMSKYSKPARYWPPIDNAMREAACMRGVEVNILVSCWNHSPQAMFVFLQSLQVLSQPPLQCRINVRVFRVPSSAAQQEIPFARVNHAKYMVTDRVAYIGTSNWEESYFTQTAGVGLVVNQTGSEVNQGQQTIQSQLQGIFERDWNSAFAKDLSDEDIQQCRKHT